MYIIVPAPPYWTITEGKGKNPIAMVHTREEAQRIIDALTGWETIRPLLREVVGKGEWSSTQEAAKWVHRLNEAVTGLKSLLSPKVRIQPTYAIYHGPQGEFGGEAGPTHNLQELLDFTPEPGGAVIMDVTVASKPVKLYSYSYLRNGWESLPKEGE